MSESVLYLSQCWLVQGTGWSIGYRSQCQLQHQWSYCRHCRSLLPLHVSAPPCKCSSSCSLTLVHLTWQLLCIWILIVFRDILVRLHHSYSFYYFSRHYVSADNGTCCQFSIKSIKSTLLVALFSRMMNWLLPAFPVHRDWLSNAWHLCSPAQYR